MAKQPSDSHHRDEQNQHPLVWKNLVYKFPFFNIQNIATNDVACYSRMVINVLINIQIQQAAEGESGHHSAR
ncbi:hypothetical protein [Cohaesibacter sp. ES.047]|uniref:hypothetical protein n=1 Tax=Cohaesibacter sp. ES.047 TaxID=1798205 RepID=UPI0012FE6E9C|nr:hypothetical protein [Cohaesibacter sp. ES.047]